MVERIVQLGTSRFLQAHADLFVHEAREEGQAVGPITVVQVSGSPERAGRVARRLRTGQVSVNGGGADRATPFGGYKQSGLGREFGPMGFGEFLEVKALLDT